MPSYFDIDIDSFLTCAEAEVLAHFGYVSDRQKVILAHAARVIGQASLDRMKTEGEPSASVLIPFGRDIGFEIRLRAALQENPPLPALSEWDRAKLAADLALAFMAVHEIYGWSLDADMGADDLHRALEMKSFATPLTDLTPSEQAIYDLCLRAVRFTHEQTHAEIAESRLWRRFQEVVERHHPEQVDQMDAETNRNLTQRFVDAKFDPEFEGRFFINLGAEPIAA